VGSWDPLWPEGDGARSVDVVGVGQISLDRVWLTAAGEGGSPPVGLPEFTGGQVATAVLALARLGARCVYLGAVGGDAEASRVLEPLERARVDCSAVVHVAEGRTRRALIRVDPAGGERRVQPERDPRVRLEPADLERRHIEGSRALLIDAEDPEASLWAARVANAAGVAVVLDADRRGHGVESLLPVTDFPIVSHEFAEAFSDGSVREALRSLASRSRHLAVVTLGAKGAIAQARDSDEVIESPAFEVEARDTTGAGDVFHAAFIWGLLGGLDARAALRTANAAAAMSCRALGAQGGLPDREGLAAFLESHAPG
jgi:sulfofructose kinase